MTIYYKALLLREKDEDVLGEREFDLHHEPHTGVCVFVRVLACALRIMPGRHRFRNANYKSVFRYCQYSNISRLHRSEIRTTCAGDG